MKPRQDSRWPDAHVRLKRLYEERVPAGMSQEQFGSEYGIGTQGMVWQYLAGYTPLNYDAAAKFAEGLRCTIKDISPEMDRALREGILPALGLKAWRRAAAVALFVAASPLLAPSDAHAGHFLNAQCACVLCQIVRRTIYRFIRFLEQCHGSHYIGTTR